MKKFQIFSLEDTKQVAEFFSKFARVGVCFALSGDLGSGKTTFSQFLIKSLIPTVNYVSSPTFNIVHSYEGEHLKENIKILHVDCYRLENRDEFFELGLDEEFENCVSIVEWYEIIEDFLPKNTIKLNFSVVNNNSRVITSENCFNDFNN